MGGFLSTYIFLVGVEKPECKVAGLGSSSVVAQGAGVACQEITATNSTGKCQPLPGKQLHRTHLDI